MRHLTLRSALGASVAAYALVAATPSLAQSRTFNVPRQAAVSGIPEFARQADIQILVSDSAVRGKTTMGLKGAMSTKAALQRLIAGAGLKVASTDGRTFTLAAKEPPQGNGASEPIRLAMASSSGEDNASSAQLDTEIVVTAGKRESLLSRTPMTISAFNARDLEGAESQGVLAVVSRTPGLSAQSAGPGRTTYAIRGIASTSGVSPTVGFYLDDIPITPPTDTGSVGRSSIDPDLYDLNRIEVLQGPQGTLYGSGSLGGTIRLITNQPRLGRWEGSVQLTPSYTDHGGMNFGANAMVNVPLGDRLALRVVATEKSFDGFIDTKIVSPFPKPVGGARGNVVAAPTTVLHKSANTLQQEGLRASLLYQPTSRLSITATTFLQRIKQKAPNTFDSPPGRLEHYAPLDIPERFKDRFQIYNLVLDYDFGPVKLTSSTAYSDRRIENEEDLTEQFYTVVGAPDFTPTPSTTVHTSKQLTQETRLTSTSDGRFKWIFGSFYQHYKGVYDSRSIVDAWVPIVGTSNLFTYIVPAKLEQFAIFGEASYKLTDTLELTAGLRQVWANQRSGLDSTGLFAAEPPFDQQTNHTSSKATTPKFTVSYTPTREHMIYATYAKGARVGGTNIAVPVSGSLGCATSLAALGLNQVPIQFSGDSVSSFEIGTKNKLLDGHLSVEATAFNINWKDIQQQFRLACGYSYTDNFGTAVSRGGTVNIQVRPAPGLNLSASAGYTDGHYTKTVPGVALKGEQIQNSPKWTSSQQLQYEFPLGTDLSGSVELRNTYYGKSNDVIGVKSDYDIISARLGLTKGVVTAVIFLDNITNTKATLSNTLSQGVNLSFLRRVATNRPRTVGVDFKYNF